MATEDMEANAAQEGATATDPPPAQEQPEPLAQNIGNNADMAMLMDVNMAISIEIGRSQMKLQDLLSLSKGSVIELDKLPGEPLDVYVNGKLIAHGDVISVNGKYGVRLTDVPKKAGIE